MVAINFDSATIRISIKTVLFTGEGKGNTFLES